MCGFAVYNGVIFVEKKRIRVDEYAMRWVREQSFIYIYIYIYISRI